MTMMIAVRPMIDVVHIPSMMNTQYALGAADNATNRSTDDGAHGARVPMSHCCAVSCALRNSLSLSGDRRKKR
jgi:hypothetical protein